MADDPSFLHRWSRRKREAARTAQPPVEPAATAPAAAAPAVVAPPTPVQAEPPPLPPVESLTLESDFAPFLSAKVDETVKRAAMRKLFSDPHFNVMDGLDVYIDDYSKTEPIPAAMLASLQQAQRIFAWAAEEKEKSAGDAPAPSAESPAVTLPAEAEGESQPASAAAPSLIRSQST